jgi:hypothetical protein
LGIVLSVSSKRHEDKNKDMDDQHPLEILSEAL